MPLRALFSDADDRVTLHADPVVPEDAKLEKIFDGGLVLTEGVCVAPDGMVYFSDITFTHVSREKKEPIEAGHIWKLDPKTLKATIFRSPSGMSNGLKFDADGNLLAAEGADYGGRRVTRTDMKTGKAYIIAAKYDGKPLNSPNDMTIDEKGRIYFSDPRYLGEEPIDQPVQAVYRVNTDGSIHRIITDAGKCNGVAISPDQKTMYVVSNDNGHNGIGRLRTKEDPEPAFGTHGAFGIRSVAGRRSSAKARRLFAGRRTGRHGLRCRRQHLTAVRAEQPASIIRRKARNLATSRRKSQPMSGFWSRRRSEDAVHHCGKSVSHQDEQGRLQLPAKK